MPLPEGELDCDDGGIGNIAFSPGIRTSATDRVHL